MRKKLCASLETVPLEEIGIRRVEFTLKSYSGVNLPRGVQVGIGFANEKDKKEIVAKWQEAGDKYNKSVDRFLELPGLEEHFLETGGFVTREYVRNVYGEETATQLFENFYNMGYGCQFRVARKKIFLSDESTLLGNFTIDGKSGAYDVLSSPSEFRDHDGKLVMYDWSEDERYLAYELCFQFDRIGIFDEMPWIDLQSCDYALTDGFDPEEFQAAGKAAKVLDEAGYLDIYELQPGEHELKEVWDYYTNRKDNAVLYVVLDPTYKEDEEIIGKIKEFYAEIKELREYEDDEEQTE